MNFVTANNEVITVMGKEGQNILDLAHFNDIDLEGKLHLYLYLYLFFGFFFVHCE